MEPYQKRVIEERHELDKKRKALYRFIATQEFQCLADAEKTSLGSQHQVMTSYSSILTERINRF